MDQQERERQTHQSVYMLLKVISSAKKDTVTLFKTTYREFFSIIQVPPIQEFEELVVVDKQTAVNFLKRTYKFFTREELHQELKEIAEEINGS